uniref:cell adhesion molecule CEACAM5-like n=1 Tax=Pristiophorus japonicus TaxID=55135 RepID=UPI00398EF6C0
MARLPSVLFLLVANLELALTLIVPENPIDSAPGNSVYFLVDSQISGTFQTAWTFNSSTLIARGAGSSPQYSLAYKGRAELFTNNGTLRLDGVTLKDTGLYKVDVSDITSGQAASAEIQLRVHTALSNARISISPVKDIYVEDVDNVTLTCSAMGSFPTYSWSYGGKPLLGNPRYTLSADSSSLSINPLKTTDNGEFVCTMKNIVNSIKTPAVMLKIYARVLDVKISISPVKDIFTENVDDVTLKCSAAGTDPTYSWNFDGNHLPVDPRYTLSADKRSLSIKPVHTTDSKEIVCIASNAVNKDQSKALILKIYVRISKVTVSISPTLVGFVENKDNVTLQCAAEGTSPNYSWSATGQRLPDNPRYILSADNSSLTINPVLRSDSQGLFCTAKNSVSSDRSKSVNLIIYYGPDSLQTNTTAVQCGSNYPGQYCVKEGTEVTLLCETQSVPDCNFTWIHNGNITGNKHNHVIQSVEFKNTGNYTCSAENSYTKKNNDSQVSILVYRPPSGHITCDAKDKGDKLNLSCSWVGGVPQTAIELRVGSTSLNGSNEEHYTIEKKDLNSPTALQCTGQHVISTRTCRLVLDKPQLSSPSNPQVTVAPNANITLEVSLTERLRFSATELLPATFAWSKGNTPITASDSKFTIASNHTFSQLIIKSLETADEGKYTCLARNAIGEKAFEFEVNLEGTVNVGIIVGATVGAIVLLVIISLVVFYIYKKKRRDDSIDAYLIGTTSDNRNPPDSSLNPYLTGTTSDHPNPPDMYAQVHKSNKTENKADPADLYSQVNKSNKPKAADVPVDLYAKVSKLHKGKDADVPVDLYARVNKPHKGKVAAHSAWLFSNNRSEEGGNKENA